MAPSFERYARWFVSSLGCGACSGLDQVLNVNDGRPGHEYPVRPQPGVVELDWFSEAEDGARLRVLILGNNPHGGYKAHDRLYREIYPAIERGVSPEGQVVGQADAVAAWMPSLLEEVLDYRVNAFCQRLPFLSNKRISLAVANQVLCRTSVEADGLHKAGLVEAPMARCLVNRQLELISALEPDRVISLGFRKPGNGWSEECFRPMLGAVVSVLERVSGSALSVPPILSVQHTSRPNNLERALQRVHEHQFLVDNPLLSPPRPATLYQRQELVQAFQAAWGEPLGQGGYEYKWN